MAASSVPDRAPYRFFGILRLVLAACVVLQHADVLLPAGARAALRPLEIGNIAVFCFFVVSGFVIAEAISAFYADRPGAFLANRLLRLLPSYVAAVWLSALVMWAAFGTFTPEINEAPITHERFAVSTAALNMLALLPVWKTIQGHWPVPDVLELAWALRIEVLFYLAMAACIVVAVAARMALIQVLTAAGTAMLLMLSIVGRYADGTSIENAPYFVLGVAFYAALARRHERWLPGAFCVTAGLFIATHLLDRAPVFGIADFPRDRGSELTLLVGLLGVFAILARIGAGPSARAQRLARIDARLGALTYPLYLMHWPIVLAAQAWLPHGSWASVGLTFLGAAALAGLTTIAIEEPVATLRRRLRKARTLAPPSTAPETPIPGAIGQ